jgi:uncharacterized membrane protein
MASKYDTNPLDPDFPKKAGHSQHTEFLPNLDGETRSFSGAAAGVATATEEPTRRYDNANFAQYSAPYAEQPPGPMYQTTQFAAPEKPSKRKILGIPENILMVLPYTPFYIGLIASVLELLFVPQSETKVRFHAAQGFAAHIAIFLVSAALGVISGFTDFARFGSGIFTFATTILLIVSMVRLWRGKAVHFESLDTLTNWLSEKVKMQSK